MRHECNLFKSTISTFCIELDVGPDLDADVAHADEESRRLLGLGPVPLRLLHVQHRLGHRRPHAVDRHALGSDRSTFYAKFGALNLGGHAHTTSSLAPSNISGYQFCLHLVSSRGGVVLRPQLVGVTRPELLVVLVPDELGCGHADHLALQGHGAVRGHVGGQLLLSVGRMDSI